MEFDDGFLLSLLAVAVTMYLVMIGLIVFSGAIEARLQPRDQDRPDAPKVAQPGPDVREGQWPNS